MGCSKSRIAGCSVAIDDALEDLKVGDIVLLRGTRWSSHVINIAQKASDTGSFYVDGYSVSFSVFSVTSMQITASITACCNGC